MGIRNVSALYPETCYHIWLPVWVAGKLMDRCFLCRAVK